MHFSFIQVTPSSFCFQFQALQFFSQVLCHVSLLRGQLVLLLGEEGWVGHELVIR
jgi:hypothetical protein